MTYIYLYAKIMHAVGAFVNFLARYANQSKQVASMPCHSSLCGVLFTFTLSLHSLQGYEVLLFFGVKRRRPRAQTDDNIPSGDVSRPTSSFNNKELFARFVRCCIDAGHVACPRAANSKELLLLLRLYIIFCQHFVLLLSPQASIHSHGVSPHCRDK